MKYMYLAMVSVCGCLMMSTTAMAYTSADCTNVTALANQGVVSYRSTCREYNLDRTITRQEVAAVALKVGEVCGSITNIPPMGGYSCDNMFSDVSATYPNDWVCRIAETLARDGIVSLGDQNQYGDAFFRPLKNVTRAEALAMILQGGSLEFQGVTYDDWRFTGSGAVSWQKPLMQYAYDRDIIPSITTFGPNTNAYRRDVFNYATAAINLCRGNTGNNNYNNTVTCGIGQYKSGNSCYQCNSAPTNAYYATANTCIWTCNSGYYKSGNACIVNYNNNNNYGTMAQCGTARNSCTLGYSTNLYDSGNSSFWNCTGTNGTVVSCSLYNSGNYYGTTGQCGNTVNSCISGTFYDTTDYGNIAYWNCTGTNGTAVSCSTNNYNNNYGVNGQCGSTVNTCVNGYLSNTIYSGGYTHWSCTGTNNVAVSCSAYGNNNYGTTGQCGSTINSCTSGTFYDTTDYGNYAYWNCTGSNGTAVSCSMYNAVTCGIGQYKSGNSCYSCNTPPANAYYATANSCIWTCNSGYYKSGNTCISNYNYGTTAQCGTTVNSCYSGTFYDTADYGNYAYWNCMGSNGTSVSCSAYNYNNYGTTGQCGSTVNSCISGTFYDTTDYGNYAYWNCTGTNGTAVTCSAYNYNYGTTAQCGNTINSCYSGTFYDTADYGGYAYWNCMGSNGTSVSCNAYNYNNYGTSGQCGTTRNTCTMGYSSNLYDSGNSSFWNCTGSNGTAVSCSSYGTYNNYNNPTVCDKPISANAYYTNNSNCWSCNAGYTLVGDLCVWWYN